MLGALTRLSVNTLLTVMNGQWVVLLAMDEQLRFATNKNKSFCVVSPTNGSATIFKVTGTQHQSTHLYVTLMAHLDQSALACSISKVFFLTQEIVCAPKAATL